MTDQSELVIHKYTLPNTQEFTLDLPSHTVLSVQKQRGEYVMWILKTGGKVEPARFIFVGTGQPFPPLIDSDTQREQIAHIATIQPDDHRVLHLFETHVVTFSGFKLFGIDPGTPLAPPESIQ